METINTYYSNFLALDEFVKSNRDILLAKSNHAVLVQVFAGVCDKNELATIANQIRELVPGSQVIGTTTNGEIMNGVISGLKTVVSFSVFENVDIKVAFLEKSSGSDFELGQAITKKLDSDKGKVLILFVSGLTVNATQLLKGVQSVNAGLPVAGGNAGDNLNNNQCFVFANDEITDCGVVGAILQGEDLVVNRHSHLGWQPIGKEMTITKAEGPRVYTIDHLPAYQVYRRYLGANEQFDILNSVEFPLAFIKHGLVISRSPFFRYEDDSLAFFGDIEQGEKVRLSFGHINIIKEKLDSLLATIRQQPVESIFVYSCAARRSLLSETAEIETRPLQEIAPTAGFFTAGEFFHANNSNQFLNNTMTIMALSEASDAKDALQLQPDFKLYPGEMDANIAGAKDNVANRSVGILKALTSLIRTVTSELNERTVELETQRHDFINHLQTVYGLISLGEMEQAQDLIRELCHEVKLNGEVLRLALPEVSALLMVKMGVATSRNITFNVEVGSELVGLKIRPLDIVTILGNMINNALEAVEDLEAAHKQIKLKILETADYISFQTQNPGFIPENLQTRVFEPGFSTKKGPHRGLGLASISYLAEQHKGQVKLSSHPQEGTKLTISFPK